jgi:hypothetical protein
MSRFIFFLSCFLFSKCCFSQADSIDRNEVVRIISFLAADSLGGRGNFTPDLQKAARFIQDEFKKDSLEFMPGKNSFLLPFAPGDPSVSKMNDPSGQYPADKVLLNVVGFLRGRSKANEAIIFSAHYDHLARSKSGTDRVFNGANDDASGTTAVLLLARYYASRKDNERTLIFCTFSGEELGLFGSREMARSVNADRIVAVMNIEMIGRTNAAKKGAAFITGAEYSDFEQIFKKNLKGYPFRILRDPDLNQMLFARSDNFSFAEKGVPAHTIMSSNDQDRCYHKPCDDVKSIDIDHMTAVIKAITVGMRSMISGEDTPSRIDRRRLPDSVVPQ